MNAPSRTVAFIRLAVGPLVVSAMAAIAPAQWTVTNLHPPAATASSTAYAVRNGEQAGSAFIPGIPLGATHASRWNSTVSSWVDLHPSSASRSIAHATSLGRQAGFARIGNNDHASLWTGTAASWIDLHPSSYRSSTAYGIDGLVQVGEATLFSGQSQAGLWTGTANSFVSLHPSHLVRSIAFAVSGNKQVGVAGPIAGFDHAALWTGTAASFVDLHPIGASSSLALGVHLSKQVGRVNSSAALWSGTRASYVDLAPSGASESIAYGVFGTRQVGSARFDNRNHAAIWTGTAASFLDLHTFLPAGFQASEARGIWADANGIYVSGSGYNALGREEAILWTLPVPAPATTALIPGIFMLGRRRR